MTTTERPPCRVEDCDRVAPAGRRMCRGHRSRVERFGDPLAHVPLMPRRIEADDCEVKDCHRPRKPNSSGQRHAFCAAHEARKEHHRDLVAEVPVMGARGRTLAERRAEKGTC